MSYALERERNAGPAATEDAPGDVGMRPCVAPGPLTLSQATYTQRHGNKFQFPNRGSGNSPSLSLNCPVTLIQRRVKA